MVLALEVIFNVMRSINPRFTYLLTYWRCDRTVTESRVVFCPRDGGKADEHVFNCDVKV